MPDTQRSDDEKRQKERAYNTRTRGVALMILGSIPAIIGFAALGSEDGGEPWVFTMLAIGLAIVASGIMLWGRGARARPHG